MLRQTHNPLAAKEFFRSAGFSLIGLRYFRLIYLRMNAAYISGDERSVQEHANGA